MGETGKQDCIFLELRQRLQSGLLIIRNDAAGSPAEVRVTGGDSALQIHTPEGERRVTLPAGVRLVEGSCQEAAGKAGDGLHLRLRLKVDQHTEAPGSVIERLRVRESYCFLCRACGTRVLKDRVFRRVLPLPNGNWNALVEDWCCHPDPFANRKLLPRAEDCLLGDTYFLLARDGGCGQTLTQEPNPARHGRDSGEQRSGDGSTAVSCKRCAATLGEAVTAAALKLYITEVVVGQSDEDCRSGIAHHRLPFLERCLAARLVELSSAQSMFRFSIQTPGGKAFILLWLLNTDTLVASFSENTVGGDVLISPSNGRHDEHQSCQAVSAVKVLYLPCAPSMHHDVVDAWEKNIGVHPLTLPLTTCQEVLQLLAASTSCLPPSLRCMDSYQVAFMRT